MYSNPQSIEGYYYKTNEHDLVLICKMCGCLIHKDCIKEHEKFHMEIYNK